MELINKQYALASAISGIVITDENGEKWIRTRDVRESIMNVPIIEAEPIKHGRWITVSDGYGNGVATASICECSLCKDTIWVYKNDKRKWRFCPNCGARMDGGEDDAK